MPRVSWTRDRCSVGVRIGRWWIRLVGYRMDNYDAMLTDLMTDSLIYGRSFVRVAPDEVLEL